MAPSRRAWFNTVCGVCLILLLIRALVNLTCMIRAALSPFKQRALAGALHGYLFNGYARIAAQAPYFAIPFGGGMSSALNFDMIQMIPDASSGVIAYAVYVWANKRDAFLNSKAGHGHGDH